MKPFNQMALLCFIVICVLTLAQAEMNSMNMSMITMNLGKLDNVELHLVLVF